MRNLLGIIAASAILLLAAAPAHAISVALDVPVANDTTLESGGSSDKFTASSISGYSVTLGELIWYFGVGHQEYTFTLPDVNTGGPTPIDLELEQTMNNIVLDLPTPIISISLGYGIGTIDLPDLDITWEATQYLVRLGWKILPLFDIHAGMEVGTATSSDNAPDLDYTTTTIGARLAF